MIKAFLTIFLFASHIFVQAQAEVKATLYSDLKTQLEFGGSYDFSIAIYPFELNAAKDVITKDKELLPFIHITKIESIDRSENNYDAVVIRFTGVLTAKYTNERSYLIGIGTQKIPLKLELPEHGKEVEQLKDFTMLGHAKPEENFSLWYLFIVFILVTGILLAYWYFRKNKTKTLYEDLRDELSKYTENKQLEYLYVRRREIINENSDSKIFFDKIGRLQYRKDWTQLDKKELLIEKDKIIEGLHGTR